MKYLYIILVLLLLGCNSNIKVDSSGLNFEDEDKCIVYGEERCKNSEIQICFGDYWGTIIDCSTLDGGTCCTLDGGTDCCN